MIKIDTNEIKRHGNHIRLGQSRTAIEGKEGNLNILKINENGKQIKFFRGSSLIFSTNLTGEDKKYLASLGSDN